VNEFPERLVVSTKDNFLQNSFDIYYESPETSRIPCKHSCEDKETCGHICCCKYSINVKVTCMDRDGIVGDHLILLSGERNKGITLPFNLYQY
jgi:hypothetical protein